MKPENLSRLKSCFADGLSSRKAERGIRAEKKADAGDLFIYDEIGESFFGGGISAKAVADRLDEMKGVKTLNVYINSPGGSVFDGKAIFNQLSRFGAKKNVVIDGIAASAASFIAMAGDKITMSPGATMMVHEAMGGAFGYADELDAVAEVLRLETKNIAGIYSKRTGCTMEDCLSMMADETWMDAKQAKEAGFCDEIVDEACACSCPECSDGACADCSCGGCDACGNGGTCNEGHCDQGAANAVSLPIVNAIEETRRRAGTVLANLKRARVLDRLRPAASREGTRASPEPQGTPTK